MPHYVCSSKDVVGQNSFVVRKPHIGQIKSDRDQKDTEDEQARPTLGANDEFESNYNEQS